MGCAPSTPETIIVADQTESNCSVKEIIESSGVCSHDLAAVYRLGRDLYSGQNQTPQNHVAAANLWDYCVKKGHVSSMFSLGVCYEFGHGIEQDLNRAIELYQQGAKKGNLPSVRRMEDLQNRRFASSKKNCKDIVKWYTRASEMGDPEASRTLGHHYLYGIGVKTDEPHAINLFIGAANQGDIPSMRALGIYYDHGRGVAKNKNRAIEWYNKAAEGGDPVGYLRLAWHLCSSGDHVKIADALTYLAKAIRIGGYSMDDAKLLGAEILAFSNEVESRDLARETLQSIPNSSRNYAWSQGLLNILRENYALDREMVFDFVLSNEILLIAQIARGRHGPVLLGVQHRSPSRLVAIKYIDVRSLDAANAAMRDRFACRVLAHHKIGGISHYLGCIGDGGNKHFGLVFRFFGDLGFHESEASDAVKVFQTGPTTFEHRCGPTGIPDWSNDVRTSLRSYFVEANVDRKHWPVHKILKMLAAVADALDALHKAGILHCDIAARNILCNANGDVRLTDFGCARFWQSHETSPKYFSTVHQPGNQYPIAWMSPESIMQQGGKGIYSVKSDVYSFGLLIWQCFAHRDPFYDIETNEADEIASLILEGRRPSLNDVDDDTPMSVKNIIEECLIMKPEYRPSLHQISRDLRQIAKAEKDKAVQELHLIREVSSVVPPVYRVLHQHPSPPQHRSSCSDRGSILRSIHRSLKDRFDNDLFDIGIVHTGAQKWVEASTLQDTFERAGLKVFIDRQMEPWQGPPKKQMWHAFETCRCTVVLLSREFLERKDPCDELIYSVRRMEWLRNHGFFESLCVVLFRISLREYNEKIQSSTRNLPVLETSTSPWSDIGKRLVVYEWTDGPGDVRTWSESCQHLCDKWIDYDESTGLILWKRFLRDLDQYLKFRNLDQFGDFPRAHQWLYID